jgi:hypothetical protein
VRPDAALDVVALADVDGTFADVVENIDARLNREVARIMGVEVGEYPDIRNPRVALGDVDRLLTRLLPERGGKATARGLLRVLGSSGLDAIDRRQAQSRLAGQLGSR